MTTPKILMRHIGGATHVVRVLGREHGSRRMLYVDWGDLGGHYTIDLKDGQLVIIKSNKISKRLPWFTKDLEDANDAYDRFFDRAKYL